MDLEILPGAILIVLIGFVAAMGLWYLALRFQQPRLKTFAVMIGVFPLLGLGLQTAVYFFDWGGPPDYKTVSPGPGSHEASATRDVWVPVTDHSVVHEVELTPRAGYEKKPPGVIRLHAVVLSPNGQTLMDKTETLAPAKGQFWTPLRAQFQPTEDGDHTMHLEIPAGVKEVKVKVRELRN